MTAFIFTPRYIHVKILPYMQYTSSRSNPTLVMKTGAMSVSFTKLRRFTNPHQMSYSLGLPDVLNKVDCSTAWRPQVCQWDIKRRFRRLDMSRQKSPTGHWPSFIFSAQPRSHWPSCGLDRMSDIWKRWYSGVIYDSNSLLFTFKFDSDVFLNLSLTTSQHKFRYI